MKKREKMKDSKVKHFNPMALREKFGIGSRTNSSPFSSFWADTSWDTRRTDFIDEDEPVKKGVDHVALASYRRAISNFVTIVTNDPSIPVKFQDNDESFTDGKKVVIGSKINEKNFDPVVGLALHEGSHIKLSDFEFLKNLEFEISKELFLHGEKKGFSKSTVMSHVKNMLNYVEDRRIDFHIFSTSPGYKGYYNSMYDKYFHSKVVDKALLSDEYTSLDWDSYIFRILNLTNKNRRLEVLPNLKEIYELVFKVNGGVKNLKSSKDSFLTAVDIVRFVYKNIPDGVEETDESSGEINTKSASDVVGDGGSETLSDKEFDALKEKIENGGMESGGSSDGNGITIDLPIDVNGGSSNGTPSNDKKTKKIELTESQKRSLENAIKKQKDFTNGETKKTGKLSKKDSRVVQTMEEAGVVHKEVGKGFSGEYDYNKGEYVPAKGVKVVVVKKLTKAMIEERMFPSILGGFRDNEDSIHKGTKLGTILGKKLQVRGESRDTKWTRKDTGKIDKRLIAELGFGNDRVFSTNFVESYSDAILHISVDASGSMSGDKWNNTMTSVVAICKAASMITNVDVVVSFRSTHDSARGYRGGESFPLVLIGYDSRVDKFSKISRMWKKIHAGGTTPEGLCFEAIMNQIVPTSNDRDSYFLNFSDGMPMFSNHTISYYRDSGLNHTRKMVKEIRSRGIKVLSYYVGDSYESDRNMEDFKRMYGKDSEFVDVTNVMSVSKTMNKKFLEK